MVTELVLHTIAAPEITGAGFADFEAEYLRVGPGLIWDDSDDETYVYWNAGRPPSGVNGRSVGALIDTDAIPDEAVVVAIGVRFRYRTLPRAADGERLVAVRLQDREPLAVVTRKATMQGLNRDDLDPEFFFEIADDDDIHSVDVRFGAETVIDGVFSQIDYSSFAATLKEKGAYLHFTDYSAGEPMGGSVPDSTSRLWIYEASVYLLLADVGPITSTPPPPLVLWPRDDDLGSFGVAQLFPQPSSEQSSPNRGSAGAYL